jgi:hypothetical protein
VVDRHRQKTKIWFRLLLAEHGVETTLKEATDNYAVLMVAVCEKILEQLVTYDRR